LGCLLARADMAGLGKRGGPGELGAQSGAHRGSRPARHPTHAGQAANDGPALDAAKEQLDVLQKAQPDSAGVAELVGDWFEAAGKHSDAVTAWRAALKGRPDDAAL